MSTLKGFGIRELHVSRLAEEDNTYGQLIKMEGVSQANVQPVSTEYRLEGDDTILDVRSVLEAFTLAWTNGVLSLSQLQAIEGGKIDATSGVYTNNESDKAPYFGVVARVVAGEGEEDLKVVFPKVKLVTAELAFQNKTYALCNVSATAIKDATGDLRRMFQDSAPITAADLTKK